VRLTDASILKSRAGLLEPQAQHLEGGRLSPSPIWSLPLNLNEWRGGLLFIQMARTSKERHHSCTE